MITYHIVMIVLDLLLVACYSLLLKTKFESRGSYGFGLGAFSVFALNHIVELLKLIA